MKLKHLKALLENYPDDMEVLIVYKDNYREHIEDEFAIRQYPMNYCVYTTLNNNTCLVSTYQVEKVSRHLFLYK
jgi:hypothetical protein